MAWSPIELFYKNLLAANTTVNIADPAYPFTNAVSRIDGTFYKSTSATQEIVVAYSGASSPSGYLLVFNHNLAGNIITVTSGAEATVRGTVTVPNNKAILLTWTTVSNTIWNIKILPQNGLIPFIAGLQLGEKVVLDYADAITPYDLENKGVVNVSDTGYVQGIHNKYIEHALTIKFSDADAALLAKVQAWEETVGLGLCGILWDPGEHAADVRVVRRKGGKFTAPMQLGGLYADITLNLIGRKE